MKNYCVYRHRRLDNNQIFYVGIGSIKRAYKKAKNSRNQFWLNIINKTEYNVEILYENLDLESAKELEIFLIELYGRRDLNKGNLVNLTNGGEGTVGRIISDKHKAIVSKSMKNRKISNETLDKMSKAKKNMYFLDTNPNAKKVINIETNCIFNTLKEASNSISKNYSSFKWSIKNAKNFKFKYYE